GEGEAPDQCIVLGAEQEERIGLIGPHVLGVAAQALAKRRTGQIVGRPGRFPRGEKLAARLAQLRPGRVVRPLRATQHDALAYDRLQRLRCSQGTKQSHRWTSSCPAVETLGDCRGTLKPLTRPERSNRGT